MNDAPAGRSPDPVPNALDHTEDRVGSRVRRLGLELDFSLSYEGWLAIGERLRAHADASCWWLGDWLIFGEDNYGSRYAEAIAASGLAYKTLRNYAVVARRFPMSRRRDNLTFQHHAEVTALSDDMQDKWLDLAAKGSWSRAELRRHLRGTIAAPQSARRVYRLSISSAASDRWEAAASRADCDIQEWIVCCLNAAADQALR